MKRFITLLILYLIFERMSRVFSLFFEKNLQKNCSCKKIMPMKKEWRFPLPAAKKSFFSKKQLFGD